jgi:hypothetical protein
MDSDHECSGINPFRQITRGCKKKRPPAQTGGRKSAAENRKYKSCHGQTLG